MMCSVCVHEPVCNKVTDRDLLTFVTRYGCRDYIDINCFIKLPCKIGEKIFAVVEKKKATKDEKYRYIQSYYLTYSNIERVIKNFSKTIFLTKEEAEDALEKINATVVYGE